MARSTKAIYACANWLSACIRMGWDKSLLDELERIWWQWHDDYGNMIERNPKSAPRTRTNFETDGCDPPQWHGPTGE